MVVLTWVVSKSRGVVLTHTRSSRRPYVQQLCTRYRQQQQQQQRRGLQYLFDPMAIPMMKYHPNRMEPVHMKEHFHALRQERIVFHWFRIGNLRLYDNMTLFKAAEMAFDSRLAERRKRSPPKEDSCYIIPIVCLDTHFVFGTTCHTPSSSSSSSSSGTTDVDLRINVRRAQFIIDSVLDLRRQLECRDHPNTTTITTCTDSTDTTATTTTSTIGTNTIKNSARKSRSSTPSKLLIACGDPKVIWEQIVDQIPTHIPIQVFVQEEPIREARREVMEVQAIVQRDRKQSHVQTIWDSSIYDPKYIHYGGRHVPLLPNHDMNGFRVEIESRGKQQHPIVPIPKYLLYPLPPIHNESSSSTSSIETDDASSGDNSSSGTSRDFFYNLFHDMTQYVPTLHDLGYSPYQIDNEKEDSSSSSNSSITNNNDSNNCVINVDPRSVVQTLRGGETAANERLKEYFWHTDLLKAAYTTRYQMMDINSSSKLSVYIAHGCISPKFIISEIKRYRKSRISNMSTYYFEFQLLKREYCKLYFVKHGEKIFLPNGPINIDSATTDNTDATTEAAPQKIWTTDKEQLQAWKNGMTGYPIVDACMRELKYTGYMSNLGRQVCAYFLTYHMSHDWRDGGDYFESRLLDSDIYSNWTNWCIIATSPVQKHVCLSQKSIGQEQYIKSWIPELQRLPTAFIYKPYIMNDMEQREYNIILGTDYPLPIVKLSDPPPTDPALKIKKKKKIRVNRIIRKKKMKR